MSAWDDILSSDQWSSLPQEWLDNQPGPSALLFRTHRHHDPLNETPGSLVHAAPRPLIGTSSNRLNSQKMYQGAPGAFNFITVYSARPGQKFYRDETLEHVYAGREPDSGECIEDITTFHPDKHFETDAAQNPVIGTYLVSLPKAKSGLTTSVDIERVRVLLLDDRIRSLLQSVSIAASTPVPATRTPDSLS